MSSVTRVEICLLFTDRSPLCRYLHRLISFSITARYKSWEWCTSSDFLFFYCLM
ncbi:hypothetical protein Hanom_Chr10g00893521 [Helianthus anomalus]